MSEPYLELWTDLLSLLSEEELIRLCKRATMRDEMTIGLLRLSDALWMELQAREAAAEAVVPPLPSAYE